MEIDTTKCLSELEKELGLSIPKKQKPYYPTTSIIFPGSYFHWATEKERKKYDSEGKLSILSRLNIRLNDLLYTTRKFLGVD